MHWLTCIIPIYACLGFSTLKDNMFYKDSCREIEINDSLYDKGKPLQISEAIIEGNCIKIEFENEVCTENVKIIQASGMIETYPPRIFLNIIKSGSENGCKTKSLEIRISLTSIKNSVGVADVSFKGSKKSVSVE